MKKVFSQDEQYDIKDIVAAAAPTDQIKDGKNERWVPKKVGGSQIKTNMLEISPNTDDGVFISVPRAITPNNMDRAEVKPIARGGFRLCRVVPETRIPVSGFPHACECDFC